MRQVFNILMGIATVAMVGQQVTGQNNLPAPRTPLPPNSAQKNTSRTVPEKSARELQFRRLDTNGDGKINDEEFIGGSAGKAANIKREEFTEFDLNKDGSVDFEEFKKRGNKPPDRSK